MCDPYQTNHASILMHFNPETNQMTPTDPYWKQV